MRLKNIHPQRHNIHTSVGKIAFGEVKEVPNAECKEFLARQWAVDDAPKPKRTRVKKKAAVKPVEAPGEKETEADALVPGFLR